MVTLFNIRPKGFNVGNDAIYIAMQRFIYNAFRGIVNIITLPATARYESEAKAGLTAKTVYEINQYGHGVIVGGGNLYENGELDVDLDALEALEVPMMLFSLSRGRVYNRNLELVDRTDAMAERIVTALNRKASYSIARDKQTYGYLQSIGFKDVQIGGCPTIFLDYIKERLPEVSDRYKESVLVSVRNPNLMSIPLAHQAKVYNDILAITSLLRDEGFNDIRLLCHDQRDISFAASFQDIEYIYTGDVYTYLSLLKSCALNVAYRLHAFLPCLAFDTPSIKISYDERALSMIETIGYGSWDINMIQESDVVSAVKNRYGRITELDNIKDHARSKWSELLNTMSEAFNSFAADVKKLVRK